MSNPTQGGIDESEIIEAALEASSSSDVSTSQIITRKVVPAPAVHNVSHLTSATKAAAPAGGRQVLPVVYFNLPRNRVGTASSPTAVTVVNQANQSGGILLNNVAQVLPPGARGGAFLPGLTQKITVNTTGCPVSTSGSPAGQPTFVTIRSTAPAGNSNPSGPNQPHFVTIPKESIPDGIHKPNQSHQQFVTMVPKSTLSTTSGAGQIVTIRAPILSGGGGVLSGGGQNQILTIQTPVLQQGGSNQATLVPISAANSSGKPHISYIGPVLKNSSLPNMAASASKMVLSTVPTLQKTSHTFSTATTPTVSQTPAILPVSGAPVTSIVTLTRAATPTVTFVPAKDQTALPKDSAQPIITFVPGKEPTANQAVPPKDSAQPIVFFPGKEVSGSQTVTVRTSKDSTAGKPVFTILPPIDPSKEKDPAPRINPISFKDNKVTILSTKDVPHGSPITLISKDSASFAILSKEAGNTAKKLISSKDSSGNAFTIFSKEIPSNPVVTFYPPKDVVTTQESADSVKDSTSSSMNILPKDSSSVTVRSSADSNVMTLHSSTDNSTVTILSPSDPQTPSASFTIVPPKEEGLPTVKMTDDAPSSAFTVIQSSEEETPTVTIVPNKEISEAVSTSQEAVPKPSRLTTLPFSLSPEMTVTTTEVSTFQYPQFQQLGRDWSTTATGPIQGFIPLEAFIERHKSLHVNLPESTTLTPVSETDLVTPKTEPIVTEESIILKKEPVEVKIETEAELITARRNSVISNNISISRTETESGGSDELSKCLQDAVAALCLPKEESIPQSSVIACRGDDDEVTLIKLTPSTEEFGDKFANFEDNPDDIKIELIKCTEVLESSRSDTDVEDVSINLERFKSRSPSPLPPMPSLVDAKPTKNEVLPTPKSLSNIRSPSILKNHIANKARKLDPKVLSPSQYRPKKIENLSRSDSFLPKSGTSVPKTEPKKEIKKEPDPTSTPDDFDAVKALEWKNGVGLLPGSNLKFRVNEFGFIEMISDDDKDGLKSSQQSSQTSDDVDGSAGSADEKDAKPNKRKLEKGNAYYEDEDDEDEDKVYDPEDIVRCRHCGVYGMAQEFVNQRYCNTNCQEGSALKKAAEFKREQENRALKLRRKRRRLQRISDRGSTEVKKEDNSDDPMEVDDPGPSVSKDNSLNPTPIPTPIASEDEAEDDIRDDAMSVTSNDEIDIAKTKGVPGKAKAPTQFTWVKYLQSTNAKSAPAKLFKDEGTYTKNKFKVGFKLEGIDPEHPAHFCVLSVAETKGCRLRLHFDGFSESHDFWVNIDSPEIFPMGWCQKNNRRLDPPRGFTTSSFNWTSYLKSCRAFAAPRQLFAKGTTSAVCPNGFRIGMKLEAVDRKDSSLICVASVADILDNRILVHFDSWDDMYDYWVDPSSPYIHPVGWCAENKRVLTPPNEFKDPATFSWSSYLKQTKSIPAPARAFKQRPPVGFKKGMRLEAVDKRVPQLVRVATVEEVEDHRILLHFDGWPKIYDYWVDEDCPDIHRPGWCRDTKHPLEPPLTKDDLKDTTHCATPGCAGEGHIKGSKFSSHVTVQNCPYSPENMEKEGLIPDRLNPKGDLEYLEIPTPEKGQTLNNALRLVEGRRPLGRPRKWKRHLEVLHQAKKRRISEDDEGEKRSVSPLETASKLQLELHQSVFEPGYRVDVGLNRSACWAKHSLPLHSSPMLTDDSDPHSWSPSDVRKFVSTVAGLEEKAEKFSEEEIDGEAFLLMTQQDLVDNIGLKLGPAIKLYNCIVLLRQRAA